MGPVARLEEWPDPLARTREPHPPAKRSARRGGESNPRTRRPAQRAGPGRGPGRRNAARRARSRPRRRGVCVCVCEAVGASGPAVRSAADAAPIAVRGIWLVCEAAPNGRDGTDKPRTGSGSTPAATPPCAGTQLDVYPAPEPPLCALPLHSVGSIVDLCLLYY